MTGQRQLAAPRSEAVLAPLQAAGIRLDLACFEAVLRRLNSPHLAVPSVLVAGTNGKGSTATLLASVMHAAGYRVGLYTSPHLETVLERIRFGGRTIDDEALAAALERFVAEARCDHLPTHFEALTGAAFLAFAAAELDLVVLEVGLGGRLDATNAAEPLLSLVTTIGLDHQEFLGDTLRGIAREKAGIFRSGRPALLGEIEGEARAALLEVAAEKGAVLDPIEREWRASSIGVDADGQILEIASPAGTTARLRLGLAGDHQVGNALLAVRAAEVLAQQGFPRLDRASVARGLAACRWPGRLEQVRLGDGRSVVLDGAHNAAAAVALARHVATWREPFDVVVGALTDKQPWEWLPALVRDAGTAWVTSVPSPRSVSADLLGSYLGGHAVTIADPDRALRAALSAFRGRLLITGSLYLVGALRQSLRARCGLPTATHEMSLF